MRTSASNRRFGILAAISVTALIVALSSAPVARQNAAQVAIDNDDIGGVVTSAAGPEAGVWVIAETSDFQTRFAKIVVTDDRGRYLIPDLPDASYTLWVRGYGLADSAKVAGKRGTRVNLTAVAAASDAEAAKVYPAIAWFSMIHLPTASELEKVEGGMNRYLAILKNGACVGCHQLGNAYTRTMPRELGTFASSQEAWVRRLQSGTSGRADDGAGGRPHGRAALQVPGGMERPDCGRRRAHLQAAHGRPASNATSSSRFATG